MEAKHHGRSVRRRLTIVLSLSPAVQVAEECDHRCLRTRGRRVGRSLFPMSINNILTLRPYRGQRRASGSVFCRHHLYHGCPTMRIPSRRSRRSFPCAHGPRVVRRMTPAGPLAAVHQSRRISLHKLSRTMIAVRYTVCKLFRMASSSFFALCRRCWA